MCAHAILAATKQPKVPLHWKSINNKSSLYHGNIVISKYRWMHNNNHADEKKRTTQNVCAAEKKENMHKISLRTFFSSEKKNAVCV